MCNVLFVSVAGLVLLLPGKSCSCAVLVPDLVLLVLYVLSQLWCCLALLRCKLKRRHFLCWVPQYLNLTWAFEAMVHPNPKGQTVCWQQERVLSPAPCPQLMVHQPQTEHLKRSTLSLRRQQCACSRLQHSVTAAAGSPASTQQASVQFFSGFDS